MSDLEKKARRAGEAIGDKAEDVAGKIGKRAKTWKDRPVVKYTLIGIAVVFLGLIVISALAN